MQSLPGRPDEHGDELAGREEPPSDHAERAVRVRARAHAEGIREEEVGPARRARIRSGAGRATAFGVVRRGRYPGAARHRSGDYGITQTSGSPREVRLPPFGWVEG